ncbi:hypothetical protein SAMN05216349_11434 [Oribacterium sp. KHPX15]|uniref:hypothetical protein n=1 Tax=unclassified Oribacterium TaxID=2629782 RepID=UPI0004E26C9A|nr:MULTISPECIES: hypothetical protein [unclassified Oribacterium]SEA49049.1 hypothetical protein SAMN05216349_11434 [Oribacterium sp. KHPX15]
MFLYQRMRNKRRLFFAGLIVVIFLVSCGFSSCRGPQYEEGDKTNLEETGKKQMQEWLDQHMKGSQVLSSEGYVIMIPSGPHYLTDLVTGTFSDKGETRDYLVDTRSDGVYIAYDNTLFNEVCQDYVFEILNLEDFREDCNVDRLSTGFRIPAGGKKNVYRETFVNEVWLPGELVLKLEEAANDDVLKILEEFVRNKDNRQLIEIGGSIRVPDEAVLEKYNLDFWVKSREEDGLFFENFDLSDSFEDIATYSGRAVYHRYGFHKVDEPDIRIRMKETYWVEKEEKGEIKVIEGRDSDFNDLSFQKTNDGYLITFPDREHTFDFSIYADKDSEFLKHEYHSHEDREAYKSPGSVISGDRYFENDLYWKEAGEEGFLLTGSDGIRKLFFGGEELIPRSDFQGNTD